MTSSPVTQIHTAEFGSEGHWQDPERPLAGWGKVRPLSGVASQEQISYKPCPARFSEKGRFATRNTSDENNNIIPPSQDDCAIIGIGCHDS